MMRADTGVRRVQVGCWAVARRVAAAGVVTAAALVAAAPAASPRPTPPLQSTAVVVPQGLAWPGWRVEDPAEQPQELGRLLERERRAPASVPPLLAWRAAPPPPAARPARVVPFRPAAPVTAGPEAVAVALAFALDQVGKPYVWGAEGPDAYDCSGLTQRSYAEAGVLLPRTAAEQAQVGQPVALADLRPGDLVFWAYDPANPATVHHVALYAGDGLVVQAPQPGEFVEVTPLWLDGYAGAVRVATGPAGVPLPSVQVPGGGLPGSDIWSPTFGGSPDDTAGTTSAGPSTTTAPTSSGAPTTPDATPPSTARPSPSPTGTPSPDPTATPAPDPTSPPVATKPPGTLTPAPTTPPPTTPPPTTPAPTTPPPTTPPPTTPPPTTPPPTTPAPTAPAPTQPAATTESATTAATTSAGTTSAATSTSGSGSPPPSPTPSGP